MRDMERGDLFIPKDPSPILLSMPKWGFHEPSNTIQPSLTTIKTQLDSFNPIPTSTERITLDSIRTAQITFIIEWDTFVMPRLDYDGLQALFVHGCALMMEESASEWMFP